MLTAPAVEVLYELSRFGSATEVVAPPPERVTEAPTTPECPSNDMLPEGLLVCTGGSTPEPEEIELPRLGEGIESTLQFRPVRAERGTECTDRATNPPAGEPTFLA